MSNHEQASAAEQVELTVGQLLKQERERRNLTLEQVAQQLNLKVDVLHSLEADQPDKAILPTFMRGYLRAYARFLKMPEQPLLGRFEQVHQVTSTPVKAMKTFSNRQAKQQTETRFMWLTYLIVAILLASLAAWLWQGARDFSSSSSLTEASPSTESIAEPVVTPPAEQRLADELATPVDIVTPSPAEMPEAEAEQAVVVADEQVAQPLVPRETENLPEPVTLGQQDGLDRLTMTFADNCWIDVLDGNGERIAYGNKQGGYVMELNAKGPFTITLGNPSVVSIDINQKPFDMSGFPGGLVAKFTLAGQDE